MAILYNSPFASPEDWKLGLHDVDPTLDFRVWPDYGDPSDIDCILCWDLPPGAFPLFPNVRMVASTAAGIDHLLAHPERPRNVPLTRMSDPSQASGMATYVLGAVLGHHLNFPAYRAHQQSGEWAPCRHRPVGERRVGVMGMGYLGAAAAKALRGAGFDVAGWSRTPREPDGDIATFAGVDQLPAFLARTEILVCLLPLTPETRGILNRNLFDALPAGAAIVSVGRGQHLVEEDLIAALDRGQIGGATLDVLAQEPPTPDNPLWGHPKVQITPHIATTANPRTAARLVAENLRRLRAGEPLLNCVEQTRGY